MKNILNILVVLAVLFISCDSVEEPTETDVTFRFGTTYNGDALVPDQEIYSNHQGTLFSFSTMKYYVTRISLIDDSGTEHPTGIYKLVDAFDTDFQSINHTISTGKYNSIKFFFGVPNPENETASYEGDLNIAYGMAWSWNFGYVFFRHEGSFIKSDNERESMSYHLGTSIALQEIELPINKTINANDNTITINLDLFPLYGEEGAIDFESSPTMHSTDPNDLNWILNTSSKLRNGFSAQ